MVEDRDALLPEQLPQASEDDAGLTRVVDGDGEPDCEVHRGGAPVRSGDALGHLGDPLLEQGERCGGEEADRGSQRRGVGDDVVRRRALQLGDGDDDGVEDVEGTRRHRVERQRDLGDRGHRVTGRLRLGAVAPGAVDGDLEVGETGHERTAAGGEAAADVGFDVDAVRGDDGHPGRLEDALGDHRLRPALALLGRLEHEDHGAGQLVAVGGEQPGRPDESGRVHIVAARVHRPVRRGEVEPGLLGHREGVHVPAQQDRRSRAPAAEDGDHRGERLPRRDLESQPRKRPEHLGLREGQLRAELGVGVERATQGDEIGKEGGRLGAEVGGRHGPDPSRAERHRRPGLYARSPGA